MQGATLIVSVSGRRVELNCVAAQIGTPSECELRSLRPFEDVDPGLTDALRRIIGDGERVKVSWVPVAPEIGEGEQLPTFKYEDIAPRDADLLGVDVLARSVRIRLV